MKTKKLQVRQINDKYCLAYYDNLLLRWTPHKFADDYEFETPNELEEAIAENEYQACDD